MALPPETKVPALPDPSRDPDGFLRAAKEMLDVRQGVRGNPLDRGATLRDLIDAGLAAPNIHALGKGRVSAGQLLVPSSKGGVGGSVGTDGLPIMTTPPKPRGVASVGTFSNIIISWTMPGYANHSYAEILRSGVDDIGQAVVIGSSVGNQYADAAGEAVEYYYWVRFVSTSNVKGAASNMVSARTALNPEYVMANLLATVWQPNTFYRQYQYVRANTNPNDPSDDALEGMMYQCLEDGTSGATEPTWPLGIGQKVSDGTTRWIAVEASERAPFIIGTVNGVDAVVIDTAYIGDATITVAKIKDAFLDNLTAVHGTLNFARIEHGNIFELSIDGEIKSSTYSPLYDTGFVIRNNPGRDPHTPTARQYTAEFYGDTLFSGDIRAARVLGGIIAGSVFGVPSDADGGSFEFIAIRDIVYDSIPVSRKDPTSLTETIRIKYNGIIDEYQIGNFLISYYPGDSYWGFLPAYCLIHGPFAGVAAYDFTAIAKPTLGVHYFISNGVKYLDKSAMWSLLPYPLVAYFWKDAEVIPNPINIIAYDAVSRGINRYRHRDINVAISWSNDCFVLYGNRFTYTPAFKKISDKRLSVTPKSFISFEIRINSYVLGVVRLENADTDPGNIFGNNFAIKLVINITGKPSYSKTFNLLAGTGITPIREAVGSTSNEIVGWKINAEDNFMMLNLSIRDRNVGAKPQEINYATQILMGSQLLIKNIPFSAAIYGGNENAKITVVPAEFQGLDFSGIISSAMDNNV